jgi:hypothetical protein
MKRLILTALFLASTSVYADNNGSTNNNNSNNISNRTNTTINSNNKTTIDENNATSSSYGWGTATIGDQILSGGNSSATGGTSAAIATTGNQTLSGGNSSATTGNQSLTGGNSSAGAVTGASTSSATTGNSTSSAAGGTSAANSQGGNATGGTGGNATAAGGSGGTGGNSTATGTGGTASGGSATSVGGKTSSNVDVTIGCTTNCGANSTDASIADKRIAADKEIAVGHDKALVDAANSKIRNTPSMFGPALVSSNDTCMGSTSGSAAVPGLGLSFGTTWVDENCKMLKNSERLWNMGLRLASFALLCTDPKIKEALEITGFPCPVRPPETQKTLSAPN